MAAPMSFRSIIDLWPSREALADDLGIDSRRVSKWWQRRSIPADCWDPLLRTTVARSAGLTAAHLARLAAREVAA